MVTLWSDCNLGEKLQAAFALVMFIFVAALAGVFVVNQKVATLHALQAATLLPARMAIVSTELFGRSTDDDGAYYLMDRRPVASAQYLSDYRHDTARFDDFLALANKLANSDTQRAAASDYHKFLDGPKGYLQGNEDAFALKAGGKYGEAEIFISRECVRGGRCLAQTFMLG